jgi:hypothetical protein
MEQPDFFWFLQESISILEREVRSNYCQLSSELGALRANIALGNKKRVVYFEGGRFIISLDLSKHDIEVSLSDRAVIDVIDAKYSLENAVRADMIRVKGKLDVLEQFRSCLGIYLNGALRSPGFPRLLYEYRRTVFARAQNL